MNSWSFVTRPGKCTTTSSSPPTSMLHPPGSHRTMPAGGIECANREVKQVIGDEGPQCWKYKGPERAASLSLWLYAAIWTWYIPTHGTTTTWMPRPWYPKKTTPSFLDVLAALRRCLWSERTMPMSS